MDIVTAFKYRACGYLIRRASWEESEYIETTCFSYELRPDDILANDWEIIKEVENK